MTYLTILVFCAAFIPNTKVNEDGVFRIKRFLQGLSPKVAVLESIQSIHVFVIHIFNSVQNQEKHTVYEQ